jgi:hypothetical protein
MTFAQYLKQLDGSYLAGGEAVHTIATIAQTRMLEREGLPGSVVMDCEPGDVAEVHEQSIVRRCMADSRAVAWRYLRIFGEAVLS